jgi:P27 family predicted phage terminase small subunit
MKNEPVISDQLCDEAKAYMTNLIAVMKEQDLLTSMDSAAVELIANCYDNYIRATKIIREEGLTMKSERGITHTHPAVKIQLDAQIQLDKLMDKFGLNPKARKEISKPKERKGELSPIDQFILDNREVR